ncbi:MAG: hypothetical protein J7J44_02550 [Deltaproteobacteria bacterium]|nr:hypothetical protein [Deltaproteobacteria bacterium]
MNEKENKVREINVYSLNDRKSLDAFADTMRKQIDKGKIPLLIPMIPWGTIYAPTKKKPYFRLTWVLPVQIFKDLDVEKIKKGEHSVGLDELDGIVMYAFMLFPKEKLNQDIFKE